MAGPWEKYTATASGPWSKYAAQNTEDDGIVLPDLPKPKVSMQEIETPLLAKPIMAANRVGTAIKARADQPLVSLPKFEQKPDDSAFTKAAKGTVTGAVETAESLTTPKNLAIMGGIAAGSAIPYVGPLVPPAAGTYFSYEMAKGVVDSIPAAKEAYDKGDWFNLSKLVTGDVLQAMMAKSAIKHGAKAPLEAKMGMAKPTLVAPPPLANPKAQVGMAKWNDATEVRGTLPNEKPAEMPTEVPYAEAMRQREAARATQDQRGIAPIDQAQRKADLKARFRPDPPPEPMGVTPGKPSPLQPLGEPVFKPAAESASVFENEPPKSAEQSADVFRRDMRNVSVPESGDAAAPLADAKSRIAQDIAKKPYEQLTPDERSVVDGLAEEGYSGPEPSPPAPTTPTGRGIRSRRRISSQGGFLDVSDIIRKKKPKPVEEEYRNFNTIKLSPEEEAHLRREYQLSVEDAAIPEKTVEPHAAVRDTARAMSEADVESGLKNSALTTADRAAIDAAHHRINSLSGDIYKLEGDLQRGKAEGLPFDQLDALDAQINQKRGDLRKYQSLLEGSRSSAGRTLGVFRMPSDNSWDFASWSGQAKRELGLSFGNELPKDVEGKVRQLTQRGSEAEARLNDGLGQNGYDINAEKALTEQRKKIEQVIAEKEAMAASDPAAAADLELARKQLRNVRGQYQRLLAKRESMLSSIPQLKALAGDVTQAKVNLRKEVDALAVDGFPEVVSAMLRAMPLFGARTHERNVISTMLNTHAIEPAASYPAALIDAAWSAFGGRKRTTAAVTPKMYLDALRWQSTRGVEKAKEIAQHGTTIGEMTAGDAPRELNFQHKLVPKYVSNAINTTAKVIFRPLSAEDGFNFEFSYRTALNVQAKVQALNEAKAGIIPKEQVGKRMQEILASPTQEMILNADMYGKQATFNEKSKLADTIQGARRAIPSRWARTLLFDTNIRYIRIPINLAKANFSLDPITGSVSGVVKYGLNKSKISKAKAELARDRENLSPEGLEKRESELQELVEMADPKARQAFSSAMGRGAVGGAMVLLGYHLAEKGLLTGYRAAASPSESGVDEAAGTPQGALFIGGEWRRIDYFAPVALPFLLGATILENKKRYGNKVSSHFPDVYMQVLWGQAQAIADLPMNKGLKDLQEALRSPASLQDKGKAWVKSQVGSLVPPILTDADRQVRSLNDGNSKEYKGSEFMTRVPVARGTLEDRLDVFGEPVKEIGLPLVDPFNSTKPKQEPIYGEMQRLGIGLTKPIEGTIYTLTHPETGKVFHFESKSEALNTKDELEHEGVNLQVGAMPEPEDRHRLRHQITGGLMKQMASEVIASPEYQQMTDNEKRKAIEKAFDSARSEIRQLVQNPEFYNLAPEQQIKALTHLKGSLEKQRQ